MLAQREGDAAAGMRYGKAQLEILERITATAATNVNWNQDLAGAQYMFGMALRKRGDQTSARTYMEKSARNAMALLDSGKLDQKGRLMIVGLFSEMSQLSTDVLTTEIGVRALTITRASPDPAVRRQIPIAAIQYASRLLDAQRNDEAAPFCAALREVTRDCFGEQSQEYLASLNLLGIVRKRRGEMADAEKLYRQAYEGVRKLLGDQHPATLAAKNNLDFIRRKRN
jgi:hypothetical protein